MVHSNRLRLKCKARLAALKYSNSNFKTAQIVTPFNFPVVKFDYNSRSECYRIKKGKKEGKNEMAKGYLKEGLSIELISKLTVLSKEEIKKL